MVARVNGHTYTYDALGNIKSKLHIGDYAYDSTVAGPHAVTAANGLSYHYDANGNLTEARNAADEVVRQVQYSAFNKPTLITNEGNWTEVVYGPDKVRIKREDSTGRITYYVGKLFEETSDGTTTQFVHYIGDFALYVDKRGVDEAAYHEYLHRDHLGSIVAKTSDRDTAAEWLAYDPWGEQLSVAWDSPFPLAPMTDASSTRGFTDHEHLDPVGLIHMNGRVYDPELGRFLSPDPLVQASYNSQSYNRYSYVFNNPLSFTDPTGYFCSGYVGDGCQEEVVVIGNRSAAETARQQEAMQNASNAYYASVSAPGNWMRAGNTFFNMDYFYNASLGQAPQINPMSVAWESNSTFSAQAGENASLGDITSMASMGLTGADIANTVGMCQAGACFGMWQGTNGKWYNIGWGGNQWTGARGIALFNTRSFRYVGKGVTALSLSVEVTEFGNAYINRDPFGMTDSLVDMGAMAPAFYGGLPGFVFSTSYSITDNTFGPYLSSKIADMWLYSDELGRRGMPVKSCTYGFGCY